MYMRNHHKGFTLVELIVVMGVITIIATLVVVSFSSARLHSRDSRRVHDVQQIQTALELYYTKNHSYPTAITPGQTFSNAGVIYIDPVPSNPTPRTDGACLNQDYIYTSAANNTSYILNFCLGNDSGNYASGENSCYNTMNCLSEKSGLVAWWKMDEGNGTTIADTSGNNNNGTLVSSPTWQAETNCKSGSCLSFDASNYGTVNDSNSLDLKDKFTISLWMKSNSLIQTNRYLISKLNNSSSDNVYSIIYGYSANKVQFYASGNSYGYPSSNSNITISDTNWHHIVYTYDGSVFNGYLDSVAITPVNVTSNLAQSTGTLKIASFNGTGYYFNGLLDDVRIYNRALSSAEVLSLYYRTR